MNKNNYTTRHWWVSKELGKAKGYDCDHCEEQAKEWATIHGKSGKKLKHYIPLCHRCHQKYDDKWNAQQRSKVSESVKKTWADNPSRRVFSEEHRRNLSIARQLRAARERGDA